MSAVAIQSEPIRIRRERRRGWRMPAGAVYVGRPSRWGNPYRVCEAIDTDGRRAPALDAASCVELFRRRWDERLRHADPRWREHARSSLAELRGRDLVCWCALDAPCHTDVLLEMANGRETADG